MVRRLPHLAGFTNLWRIEFKPVNLDRLLVFEAGSIVSPETLAEAGIIKANDQRVAILGGGENDRPLIVKAHRVSASARPKIDAAGGPGGGPAGQTNADPTPTCEKGRLL